MLNEVTLIFKDIQIAYSDCLVSAGWYFSRSPNNWIMLQKHFLRNISQKFVMDWVQTGIVAAS